MGFDSIVFKYLAVFGDYIYNIFSDSRLYLILRKIYLFFSRTSKTSLIINTVKREGKTAEFWDQSKIAILVDKWLNGPVDFFREKIQKSGKFFEHSSMMKLAFSMAKNTHVFAALAFLVILITPHGFWSNLFATLMAFALLVLMILRKINDKERIINFKLMGLYFFLFVASVIMSAIFSLFPMQSLRFLIFHLTCIIFVFVIVNSATDRDKLLTVVETLLIGTVIVGAYAIFQAIRGVPINPSQTDMFVNRGMPGRAYSTMENPNNLGQVLMMMLPFFVAVFFGAKTFMKRFIIFSMGLVPLIALALTYSRSSWIGFAVAMAVFVLLTNWKLLPLFMVGAVAMVPLMPGSVYRRILTIFDSTDSSTNYRFVIYRTIAPMLGKYWFTGVGLGTDAFMSVVSSFPLHTVVVPPHTHNLYLQIWIESGIVSVLCFLGFVINTVKRSIKNIATVKDSYVKYIIIGGTGSMAGLLTVGLAEYAWYYPRVMIMFWIGVGVLFAALNLKNTEREQ